MLRLEAGGEATEVPGPRAALDQLGGPDQDRERTQLRQASEGSSQRSDGTVGGISPRRGVGLNCAGRAVEARGEISSPRPPRSHTTGCSELVYDDRGNLLRFLDDRVLSRPTTVLSQRSARQCSPGIALFEERRGRRYLPALTSVIRTLGRSGDRLWWIGSAMCSAGVNLSTESHSANQLRQLVYHELQQPSRPSGNTAKKSGLVIFAEVGWPTKAPCSFNIACNSKADTRIPREPPLNCP